VRRLGDIYSGEDGFTGEYENRFEIDIISRSSDGEIQLRIT
jgi:hypothetical protein